ncbi:MAG: MATE family efflux transporter [Firmicutes bacterium]|nr:MATE family efflux transporter [Bacillota bacterium]
MEHTKQLGEARISKLLLKFSIPAITGMVVNALYNVVDRIFIGQGVGRMGIAGLTIAFPVMTVMMALAMLIGLGATALISIRLGEQRKEEAELIIGNAMVCLIGIALTVTTLGLIFLDPLLLFFGASAEVLPYARDYMKIILLGEVFMSIGFGMNHFIRAEGNPKIAMATMLLGAVANTILDPIFIFVLGWGVKGAAWATIISQAASAAWVLSYFIGKRSHLRIQIRNLKLKLDVIRQITAIGSAPFMMQMAASVIGVILNTSLLRYGGDLAISAMGIVNSIAMFFLMPLFGINQGAQPIIGYNYGAEKFDRVKKTLKLAIVAATLVVLLGFTMIRLFPESLVSLFSKQDPELIKVSSRAMQINLMMLPIIGFQIISSNYFQAVGKPQQAMILSLSRQVLLLIPALLILPRFFGLNGVYYAGPVADFGSSMITGIWLYFELKQLDRKHNETMKPISSM